MAEGSKEGDSAALLAQYLDICNRVISANQSRFPYCHIWYAAEQSLAGREVEFALVDDIPKATMTVTVKEQAIQPRDTRHENDTRVLRIKKSYVEDVIADPTKYIDDPSLINWDWMRVGSD